MRFDSDTELESTDNKKTCELPDGIIILVDAERFHRVGLQFQPNFIGKEASGFHDTSFLNNMKSDVYIRKELFVNVVLSSGATMFREIVDRMTNELTALVSFTTKIMVVALSM